MIRNFRRFIADWPQTTELLALYVIVACMAVIYFALSGRI
jgi:hypothetical protein